jgi:hypothetical protein
LQGRGIKRGHRMALRVEVGLALECCALYAELSNANDCVKVRIARTGQRYYEHSAKRCSDVRAHHSNRDAHRERLGVQLYLSA